MRNEKFIVTKELGKLAKWLRLLGYDTAYYEGKLPSALIIRALREERILLTRSSIFTKYRGIRVVVVGYDHVEDQIEQVTRELELSLDEEYLFRRCVECNVLLEGITKAEVKGKVPEYVFETQEIFKQCPRCRKLFWKGTHWDMVGKWLEKQGLGRKGPRGRKPGRE